MSVTDAGSSLPGNRASRLAIRAGVALLAVGLVAAALALLSWAIGYHAAPVAPKSPFGTGLREAAPGGSLGAALLAVQAQFYRGLTGAISSLSSRGEGIWALAGIGFVYGVFHAAGPGHGKAVISGYLVASERTLAKGLALSSAAALLQALVAIALVGVLAVVFKTTAASINATATTVEVLSFAGVALMGAVLTWRGAGRLARLQAGESVVDPTCGPDCDHAHMPGAAEVERSRSWPEALGIVAAAGTRPCSGAIIVLVFALAQGVFGAGVAATFAMAAGVALTTGLLASLAVFAKGLALRLAGGRGDGGARIIAAVELLAAAFVLVFGLALLAGLWGGAGGS